MNVIVKNHAKDRIHERMGLPKSISEKIAQKALEQGLKHSDTVGNLRRYLDYIYFSHENANGMRIYNNKLFIFHGSVLITVMDLPSKYFKTIESIKKSKTRADET